MGDFAPLLARLDSALADAPLASRPFGTDALLLWAEREDRLAQALTAAGQPALADDCSCLATALRNRVSRGGAPCVAPMQTLMVADCRDLLRREA